MAINTGLVILRCSPQASLAGCGHGRMRPILRGRRKGDGAFGMSAIALMPEMTAEYEERPAYAAAFFSSRNSRRRILPTLVFGSEVRNSICLGTL
ncbi:hypothetical protein V1281_006136 [Nitrobacteraceae bacterium AZCC 2161]